jgi:hypothetical protein
MLVHGRPLSEIIVRHFPQMAARDEEPTRLNAWAADDDRTPINGFRFFALDNRRRCVELK